MGSIQLQDVSKQFGDNVVLDCVNLALDTGRIVGVVGPNGAGKSTLFKLIAGLIPPDIGAVTASKGLRTGYLTQDPQLDSNATVHDEVSRVFDGLLDLEHRMHELSDQIARAHDTPQAAGWMKQYDQLTAQFESMDGYRREQKIGEVLNGLGFRPGDYSLPVAVLSGGQRCRVALAKLLLEENNMLLMDEPTNHLDINAVRWLERFLSAHRGGAAIISHDRYLLDRVAEQIIEVDARGVTVYPGNYSNYAKVKALRALSDERQFEKDQAFIAKERAFIARHLAGQRTREAQGRRTRLARRIRNGEFVLEKPTRARAITFTFDLSDPPTGEVLRVTELGKSYGDRRLFDGLNVQVDAAQRLGITGPNGTGKTTLLRILLEQVEPDRGTVRWNTRASIGYYAQDAQQLTGTQTVLDEVRAVQPRLTEQQARALLGRFQFTGSDALRPVSVLSGGEQSRVRLIKLLMGAPNVLVLDEPTNHLDIASREALESALADYPGTIIAVSHDRYFLDRVVNRLLVMGVDETRLVAGNYSDYVAGAERSGASDTTTGASADVPTAAHADGPTGAAMGKTARKRKRAAQRTAPSTGPSPTSRFDALTIEQLEQMIIECEQRIADASERFAGTDLYTNPAQLAAARDNLGNLQAELALIEKAWSERVDAS